MSTPDDASTQDEVSSATESPSEINVLADLEEQLAAANEARLRALAEAILDHARGVALQGFARGVLIREVYDPSLPPVFGNRDAGGFFRVPGR